MTLDTPRSLLTLATLTHTSEVRSAPIPEVGYIIGHAHMGMTYDIVAKQECDISVSHFYKWALRVVNR